MSSKTCSRCSNDLIWTLVILSFALTCATIWVASTADYKIASRLNKLEARLAAVETQVAP